MTREEVESILASVLRMRSEPLELPTDQEWQLLSEKFGCTFGEEFRLFIDLMSKYAFPGDILGVSCGTNDGDLISETYEYERNIGGWNDDLIPFYAIGNGDYECISAKESPNSGIYYVYHEDRYAEQTFESMAEWIRSLPDVL